MLGLIGNAPFTSEEVAAYQQMPESVRRLASVMASESFREWRARNPVRVTYQPAFGDEYIDRAVLNAAEMLSPVFRYAQRRVLLSRDEWGDLDAIRAIMSGNYNVTLGPSALNYGVWAQLGDSLLTAATIIPIGAGATATRHLVMFTAGGLTASFAMAAVEVAPIDEESRGPLRFLAGLAAGITGGTLGNAGLNIGQRLGRSATLVVRTRQLAAARTQLLELEGQMRAAVSPGSTVPSALVNRYATLTTQIERLENQIGTLRGLGGQVLRDAETALTNRMREVADLEGRAAAAGLSPAARQALLRGEAMRQARQRLSDATRTLEEVYQGIDRSAVNRILNNTSNNANAAFDTPLGTSGFRTQGEFAQATFQKYQQFIDEAYARFEPLVRNGTLRPRGTIPQNTYLGQLIDDYARGHLRIWLVDQGIVEGRGAVIQVNSRLYDSLRPRTYRVPDIRIPGARVIMDGSIELKTIAKDQIYDFALFSGGNGIVIVRPTQLGGSYGLVFPGS